MFNYYYNFFFKYFVIVTLTITIIDAFTFQTNNNNNNNMINHLRMNIPSYMIKQRPSTSMMMMMIKEATSFENSRMLKNTSSPPSSFSLLFRKQYLSTTGTTKQMPISHLFCSSSSSSSSNEYLVQARIQVKNEKRKTRQKSLDEDRKRNLKIKQLLYSNHNNDNDQQQQMNNNNGFNIPKLYSLRVSVDKELREELRMNGREKRGRVFIEEDSDGCNTIKGLKFELHAFFRCLKKSTYLLSAAMPQVLEDGSIYSPGSEDNDDNNNDDNNNKHDPYGDFIPIETDADVNRIFQEANVFFNDYNSNLSEDALNRLKRPSILLHVRKDPNFKPPPPPSYLENMANPKESETMTMLSFYSFPDNGIQDPEEFSLFLRKIWKPFDALGRVYVAKEGVNAQMSIPTNV